ncbi:DUF4245 domain-containing protein [Ornithinimicrobium sufpigmenti]|uniref:DUF4245 domain-containing protein n=1 Tax=Ornithinimicrobium sufpigmenti TaxID=2508882 RepID=UPI0015E16739|nr:MULTISPECIES: DUF4245 domain-containing protein [unclassified Ornithinimicrobium]
MSTATPPTQTPDRQPGSSAGPQSPSSQSPQDKRRKRLASYSVRNMVLSVLPVGALALVWWAIPFNPSEPVRPHVETEATAQYVAEQSDFPVWVPQPPEEWIPTVAWYEARYDEMPTWHISYETPEGEYLALTQAADVSDRWLDEVLRDGTEDREVELTGPDGEQAFMQFQGPRPSNAELAWLLGPEDTGGSTVVVHGTAGALAELPEFLESVQARD